MNTVEKFMTEEKKSRTTFLLFQTNSLIFLKNSITFMSFLFNFFLEDIAMILLYDPFITLSELWNFPIQKPRLYIQLIQFQEKTISNVRQFYKNSYSY